MAATIDAESASWTPPAKSTWHEAISLAGSASSRTSIIRFQSTKLERGPTWPPHSRPSKTKRRAPSCRKRRSRPGEGTWR